MSTYLTNTYEIKMLADAVRSKTGVMTSLVFPDDFISTINDIPTESLLLKLIERSSDLTTYTNEEVTAIKTYGLCGFPNLVTVNLPECINLWSYALASNESLRNVNIPKVTVIQSYAFQNCTTLSAISIYSVATIQSYAFRWCYALESLYLHRSTKTTLGSYALAATKIASGSGAIYVPSSLYTTYINATDWATFSAYIVSMA